MSNYQQIVPIANKIIKKYDLCDHCLGRLFSRQLHLASNRRLGKKLNSNTSQKCYICRGLFEGLNYFQRLMLEESADYVFASFSVGAIVKPSIIDRDDFIRSQYRLRGIDGIKTDITGELARRFSRKTKRAIDRLDSEITFTVNLKNESCQLRSKSITISGRYVKTQRGYPQKQESCKNCLGKGCRICDFHGIVKFESVEGVISKALFRRFGGTVAKFTWIGGEDRSSLVLGSGRPFFAKIQNPLRRHARLEKVSDGPIRVENLRIVSKSPKYIRFRSSVSIKVCAESPIDSEGLKRLKELATCPVAVYDKSGRRVEKRIFDVRYRKKTDRVFTMLIKAEGGLPIKRFVAGDDVNPGVSKVLGTPCTCQRFDFLDIIDAL